MTFLTTSKIRVASEWACAASQVVSGAGFNCGLMDCLGDYRFVSTRLAGEKRMTTGRIFSPKALD
jgi:hypothetical protein